MLRVVLVVLLFVASSARAAPTLAVFDLTNRTGDPMLDPAGPGVAGLLVARFVGVDAIQVVERQKLRAILDELELCQSGAVDEASAVEAGRLLGARYLVLGDLFAVQLPTLSVNLRIVDSTDGSVLVARSVVGDIGERGEHFFVLIEELAQEIVTALDVELSAAERIELSQVDVRELEAVLAYGRSLDRLPGEQPAALWRDKTRDMLAEPDRLLWTVRNNEGTVFPTIAFARAVGDEQTALDLEAEVAGARRRVRTGRTVAAAGLGVGLGVMLIGPVVDREGGPAFAAPVGIGGAVALGSVVAGFLLAGDQRTVRYKLEYPGRVYDIEDADALIEAHNDAL